MSTLEEAAEIVSWKWKSSGKLLKVLLVLAIGTGLILLLGFLFSLLLPPVVILQESRILSGPIFGGQANRLWFIVKIP